MVEPISIFGAAINVFQLIELGSKLVLKAAEYSTSGGSSEHNSLRSLVQQLMVSNSHLHSFLDGPRTAMMAPGPDRALYIANEECLKVSREFIELLEELGLTGYVSTWRGVRLAIKSMRWRPKIEALKDQLNHARSNLMVSIIVLMATKRDGEAVSMILPSVKSDNSVVNPPLEATITKEVRHILTNISQKSTKADLFGSTASTSSNKKF